MGNHLEPNAQQYAANLNDMLRDELDWQENHPQPPQHYLRGPSGEWMHLKNPESATLMRDFLPDGFTLAECE